jgi:molybdopterin synthase catalytic subunit
MSHVAGDDIRLTAKALDAGAAVRAVNCAAAGGVDVFVGTTRAERHAEAGELLRLEYEAYPEMAVGEMEKLAGQARARWPILGLAMWHRVGPVAVGEPSVVIAVSCPHRGEAFEACRFLIDELKKTVPIWKKEVYEGESRWQKDDRHGAE